MRQRRSGALSMAGLGPPFSITRAAPAPGGWQSASAAPACDVVQADYGKLHALEDHGTSLFPMSSPMSRLPSLHPASRLLLAGTFIFGPSLAVAHPGHAEALDFSHGFAHPFGGADHVLAMVAVGWLAARLPSGSAWKASCAFMSALLLGWMSCSTGLLVLPRPEFLVAASSIGPAVLLAVGTKLPSRLVVALAGLFAISHGWIHACEMPAGSSAGSYLLGFMCASSVLISLGMVIGRLISAWSARRRNRAPGWVGPAM